MRLGQPYTQKLENRNKGGEDVEVGGVGNRAEGGGVLLSVSLYNNTPSLAPAPAPVL